MFLANFYDQSLYFVISNMQIIFDHENLELYGMHVYILCLCVHTHVVHLNVMYTLVDVCMCMGLHGLSLLYLHMLYWNLLYEWCIGGDFNLAVCWI